MNETPGWIIAHAIVEDSRDHIHLFRPWFMHVDSFPTGTRIDFNDLRHRSAGCFPQRSHANGAAKFFLYRRVFKSRPFNFRHSMVSLSCGIPGGAAPQGWSSQETANSW